MDTSREIFGLKTKLVFVFSDCVEKNRSVWQTPVYRAVRCVCTLQQAWINRLTRRENNNKRTLGSLYAYYTSASVHECICVRTETQHSVTEITKIKDISSWLKNSVTKFKISRVSSWRAYGYKRDTGCCRRLSLCTYYPLCTADIIIVVEDLCLECYK